MGGTKLASAVRHPSPLAFHPMQYTGHIPAMRNFVVGQTYHNSTVAAGRASGVQRDGHNPASLVELVDQRPQGRQFLYAQVRSAGRSRPLDSGLLTPLRSRRWPTRWSLTMPLRTT